MGKALERWNKSGLLDHYENKENKEKIAILIDNQANYLLNLKKSCEIHDRTHKLYYKDIKFGLEILIPTIIKIFTPSFLKSIDIRSFNLPSEKIKNKLISVNCNRISELAIDRVEAINNPLYAVNEISSFYQKEFSKYKKLAIFTTIVPELMPNGKYYFLSRYRELYE